MRERVRMTLGIPEMMTWLTLLSVVMSSELSEVERSEKGGQLRIRSQKLHDQTQRGGQRKHQD